jgi:hypothetical protein
MQQVEVMVLHVAAWARVVAAALAEVVDTIQGDHPTMATGGILVHQIQDPSVRSVSSDSIWLANAGIYSMKTMFLMKGMWVRPHPTLLMLTGT